MSERNWSRFLTNIYCISPWIYLMYLIRWVYPINLVSLSDVNDSGLAGPEGPIRPDVVWLNLMWFDEVLLGNEALAGCVVPHLLGCRVSVWLLLSFFEQATPGFCNGFFSFSDGEVSLPGAVSCIWQGIFQTDVLSADCPGGTWDSQPIMGIE